VRGLYLDHPLPSRPEEPLYKYIPPVNLLTPEKIAEYRRERVSGDA
jgi:hypothetical protein